MQKKNKKPTTNIIFSGVGGQGIILASKIVAQCAFISGFMVKMNELHGMAQRGGSVISHIRFGENVYSPLVPEGKCDFLVALEELEGLRYLSYLAGNATVILNKRQVIPSLTTKEKIEYPKNIKNLIQECGYNTIEIDAPAMAKEIGNQKVENTVLLGLLSKFLPFTADSWKETIKTSVPEKTIDMNILAFIKGSTFS